MTKAMYIEKSFLTCLLRLRNLGPRFDADNWTVELRRTFDFMRFHTISFFGNTNLVVLLPHNAAELWNRMYQTRESKSHSVSLNALMLTVLNVDISWPLSVAAILQLHISLLYCVTVLPVPWRAKCIRNDQKMCHSSLCDKVAWDRIGIEMESMNWPTTYWICKY